MNNYLREPINGFTHLAGAVLSFIGLLALVIKTTLNDHSTISLTAVIIFGLSMILLYAASATYHLVVSSDKVISFLRRLDHAMIFVLIAGSYTPFCLIALNGATGWILFGIIFMAAVAGVCFKLIWFNCPRWISTVIYVAMGWISIFLIVPLYKALSLQGIALLIGGGVFYTIGALIYATKPEFLKSKYLGFHEIFHVFIMLGTLTHFFCVFKYVI
ncbi:hemolysin III family protein [Romboutsia sedimentorum]|uniref:Hemolysin III family protein n=1 Tax=Romboutsia sedimentorum TaxID=1368474 RepID=A0ABT7EBJ8_9FIRM|nr:hemolysin III family protein [Romboutsia sedimentorum]MDK2564304.1 hemolysin III family protein [Romboutsia sedimentorum]MDK2587022.1 hemolysin III family protein [Romboutsia sedimentorum]